MTNISTYLKRQRPEASREPREIKLTLPSIIAELLGQAETSFWGRNCADCVRFLEVNFRGFKQWLAEQEILGRFFVFICDGRSVSVDELYSPVWNTIEIVDAVIASGAVGKIVAGAGLIAATVAFPGAFPVVVIGGSNVALGAIALSLGVALALGGISELLAPKQKENIEGSSLGGSISSAPQGRTIPFIFGECYLNLNEVGIVASSGVDVQSIPVTTGGKGGGK